MLARYKIVNYVNLPDQVGVNDNGKVLMLNCEQNSDAVVGTPLAIYRGELYDKHDIDVMVHVDGYDDMSVIVRRNASMYDDEDEDGCPYYEEHEEDDEIFYKHGVTKDTVIDVLGDAFASVEKEINKKVVDTKQNVSPCKDKALKDLKKLLDALYEED